MSDTTEYLLDHEHDDDYGNYNPKRKPKMTQALEIRKRNEVDFTNEEIQVIKNTIAKDATDDELKLFLNQAKRTGLDPFSRQIYFIKDKGGKVTIVTSIDGLRLIAERSGQYEGQTPAQWCGQDAVWKDVWLQSTPPVAARVGVYKKGFRDALYSVALMSEYKKSSDSYSPWVKFPTIMLAKVAESLSLRKAFPNDMSGIYSEEEMGIEPKTEAEKTARDVQGVLNETGFQPGQENMGRKDSEPAAPSSASEILLDSLDISDEKLPEDIFDFEISFGRKYKNKMISTIPKSELKGYIDWLEKNSLREGTALSIQLRSLKDAAKRMHPDMY